MVSMTLPPPQGPARRPRRIIATASVLGALALLGIAGELALRGLIDDRIELAAADLPTGVSVERDSTPALLQLATGRVGVQVEVSAQALTDQARSAAQLPGLLVVPEPHGLVAQVPLSIAGSEQTAQLQLSVAAQGGHAILRADTVQLAGLTLPVAAVAEQLGNDQLDRLVDGVPFPVGGSRVAVSSARATDEGLELAAEVAIWG